MTPDSKSRPRLDQAKGLLPFLSVFLGACGGGGGGIVRSDPFSATYSGAAVKGPLQNATAFVDYNNDGLLSAGEPSVTTSANGAYSLTATQAAPIVVLTDATTVDTSTGTKIGAGVVLKAPAGSSVVSPATTLVANGATEAQVKAALNLPSGVNLATFNPFAAGADSATALAYEKASVQIFSTVSAIASAAEGAGASQAAAQAAAFKALTSAVSTAAASNTTFNLSDSTAIGQVVTATQTQLAGQINSTAFQAASTQVASAISNINTAVAGLTDLTSNRTLQTISVATKTLGEQVQTAVEGAVANPSQTVQIGLSNSANVESTISAENLAPTDLALSATTILENAANLTIGTISVTDSNTSDTHTFALSGADSALFVLNGTTLSLKASPDYEAKSSYSITITATDSGGKVYSEDFTIAVGDVNEAPVLSAPGSKAITEDAASNAVSGALAATDPEGVALTYQLVGGTLASGSYTLTGTYGTLTLNSATGAYSYSLNNSAAATNALAGGASASETFAVRVSDGSNTTVSQNLIINITGANDAPSGVTLSASSVVEGSAGATVGTLSATDPEGQTLTYTLGGTDAANFEVVNGTLKLKDTVTADRETKSSYSVTVTASDGTSSTSQSFTIAVGDVNEAPVLSAPGSKAITEDAASSTVSGALAATDPESAALTYQLVGGTLASGSYTLTGTYGTLTLNSATGAYSYSLNNSAAATNALAGGASASETFAVRVSDGSNTTASQNLIINITGANDAPVISSGRTASVAENAATSTVVYTPVVTDSDAGDTKTFSLSGPDASSFNINATTGEVTLKSSANYEAKSSYQFIVTVTDAGGKTDTQGVTLSVTNVAENYTGTIVDGYVAGATVFQDLNNNNVLDAGEANTTTNALGQFTLTGVVSGANAPIKMITGFDIGTNEPIVTTLGAPSGVSGPAVASPLSTIVSLASANQPDTPIESIVSRLGSYLGLSSSTLQTLNLLTDDPIDHLLSTDSAEAAAAKDLFAANQLVMSMSHITGAVTKYVAEQIGTQIQTYLGTQGITNVNALGSMDAYEKIGTDAVFHKIADAIAPSTLVADNTFQLKNSYISLVDYNPETGATCAHRIGLNTASNVATVGFDNGSLNLQNLTNAVNNSGNYQSPYINFELQKLATGSGSNSVTIKLVDGADGTRSGGEREVGITANLTWTSDGQTATFTLPSQTLSGYYYDRSGNRYDLTLDNVDSDLLSITSSGVDVPASLNIKLQSLLSKLSSISPGSLLGTGEYHLSVSSTLPLADANGANIDSFAVPIEISSTPSVTVFVPDVTIHEADATKAVQVYLSEARDTDVTISYHLEGGTATSGSDYTATTGTITITAGLTSATIAVPVLADSTTEGNETVRLVIDSVTGATAMNGYATVTISDAPKATSLYTNLIGTTLDTSIVTAAYQDLAAAIQTKLAATNVTVGGQTQSLATVLSGHVNTASTVTQYQTLGNALTETIWGKLQTVFAAFDGQAGASYGQSLMVANAGAKALDLDQIVGQIMSSAGSYLAGKGAADLNTLMDSYIALATDTVGDIFGVDTATYFSGATVAMLTRGDDTETLSNSSEIVAGLGGNDVVHTLGGNDKYIGGAGVDTVYGGEGNDHLYGYDGNDVLYGEAGNDMLNGGKGNDYLDGGLGNDEIIGGAGNDTIIGGGGSDTVTAGTGDDVITVGGNGGAAFNTVVNGGSGTDRLNITYSGISGLGDLLPMGYSGDTLSFRDANGGVISATSIEQLYVNNKQYQLYLGSYTFDANSPGYGSHLIWGASDKTMYGVDGAVFYAGSGWLSNLSGFSKATDNFTFVGSSAQDSLNLNLSRTEFLGSYAINLGDGADMVYSAKLNSGDQINLGAGDDKIYMMVGSMSGQIVGSLDGGAGNDTIVWAESTVSDGQEIVLNSGGITGFENLSGSQASDVLRGDAQDNIIEGNNGSDAIYGNDGNDTLFAGYMYTGGNSRTTVNGMKSDDVTTGTDSLYGGDGNDILFGSLGDNLLDGGRGADILVGASGSDTFVLRAGDGGSTVAGADTIMDFQDGADVLSLTGGLKFSDLNISQGTGSHAADAIIKIASTGEYLAVLTAISATSLTQADFE